MVWRFVVADLSGLVGFGWLGWYLLDLGGLLFRFCDWWDVLV